MQKNGTGYKTSGSAVVHIIHALKGSEWFLCFTWLKSRGLVYCWLVELQGKKIWVVIGMVWQITAVNLLLTYETEWIKKSQTSTKPCSTYMSAVSNASI